MLPSVVGCHHVCVCPRPAGRCNPTAISLKAGCELFLRYTTRTSALEIEDFQQAKKRLIERGQHFSGGWCGRKQFYSS
jgi:hypothetical protein